MDENDVLAERFEAHRARLRAVAYQALGSASEADDCWGQGGADLGDAIKGDGGEWAVPFGYQRKEAGRLRLVRDPGPVR